MSISITIEKEGDTIDNFFLILWLEFNECFNAFLVVDESTHVKVSSLKPLLNNLKREMK